MRVFWALIAILVVGAAAALLLRGQSASTKTPSPPTTAPTPVTTPAPVAPAPPAVAPAPSVDATISAEAPRQRVASEPAPAASTSAAPSTTAMPSVAPLDASDPFAAAMAEVGAKIDADAAKANAPKPTRSAATIGEYDVSPDEFRVRVDGALVVNEKFVVRGTGTSDDPFVVPWELLVSAEEVFDPAAKKNTIPERVAMLDGKHVKLDGYVAFPLMSPKPKELLSMLNQWDGCCIGVPPTPYDAVEVKLTKIVTGDARHAITGSVVGEFKVAPYVTKGKDIAWLVGLYVMENASFSPKDVVGAGS